MKVKLLVSRCGPDVSQNAGDEIEVSDAEGKRMIEADQAVPVRSEKKQTATRKFTTEKAVKE